MQLNQTHTKFWKYEEYFTYTNLNDLRKSNEIFNNRAF